MCRFDSYSQNPESLVEDFKVFGFCYYRSMKRIYVTTLLAVSSSVLLPQGFCTFSGTFLSSLSAWVAWSPPSGLCSGIFSVRFSLDTLFKIVKPVIHPSSLYLSLTHPNRPPPILLNFFPWYLSPPKIHFTNSFGLLSLSLLECKL